MAKHWILIGIAILNMTFRLTFSNTLGYHRDELLYFSLGNHPAAGYATTPPLIGILAWMIQHTLGYSIFAAKLLPSLLSAVMVFIIAAIVKEMGGRSGAQVIAAIGFTSAMVFLRAFYLFQPVCFDIFFWTIMFLLFLRYINKPTDRLLILIGIVFGLAMLNKYLIFLLLICLLLILPFTGYRDLFRKRAFYFSLIISLLIFLPNLIWQISNRLPVLDHMSKLIETQLVHVNRIQFIIDQFLIPFPAIIIVIPGLLYLLLSKEMINYRLLGYSIVMTVIILFVLRGKSYYTAGIFPVFIAAGAIYWERKIKSMFILYSLAGLMLILLIPMLPFGIPIYRAKGMVTYFENLERKYGLKFGRNFEDGTIHSLPQDYADMLGWDEIAKNVHKAWEISDKEHCIIYASNYGQAGAISIIGKKYGLPEPVSFHDAYYYWAPKKFDKEIMELIYVRERPSDDIKTLFADIREIGGIENKDAREFGTKVYLCRSPGRSFNEFWKEVIQRFYDTR